MKRIFVAIGIIAVVFFLCMYESNTIDTFTDDLEQKLERFEYHLENGEKAEAKKIINEIDKSWDKYTKVLSTTVAHEKLENIDNMIKEIKITLDKTSEKIFPKEIQAIKLALKGLDNAEMVKIENIL